MIDLRKGRRVKSSRTAVRRSSNNLDALFERFKDIKKAEGIADSTINQYEDNYSYFVEYLNYEDIPKDMRKISEDVLRDYIVYMREEIVRFENHRYKTEKERTVGLAPSTINTRMKTLRVMFNCLHSEGLIGSNPAKNVKNISEPVEEICVLDEDELRRLMNVPNQRNFPDFRDHVLMNFLLDCMTRISEALNLKVSDFNLKDHLVTIPASIAKNRKYRVIPMSRSTSKLIGELIRENKADFDSEYVFLTNYGEMLTRDHFRKRLYSFAERAHINKKVHPHLFRHTAATMFLENGGDVRHLQLLLGHSDLRMVIRYTHLSGKALAKQHSAYSGINQVIGKLNKPRKIKR